MKTYFAKYLPVKGEIKVPCIVIETLTTKVTELFQIDTENDINLTTQKLAKLFLCSRDVQIGDKYYNPSWNEWDTMESEWQLKQIIEQEKLHKHGRLKVIGEISKEAIWVKEGDEFTEDEFETYLYCLKHPDESIYGFSVEEILQWKKLNPAPTKYKVIIGVKCPTCKTYH